MPAGQKYFIECNLERGVHLKAETIRQNIPEKMDQEKFYAIEERGWLFDRNCVI